MSKPIMVIGTSAPRRRQIALVHFGADYELVYISPDIDEKQIRAADPFALTNSIALAKMAALRERVASDAVLQRRLAERSRSVAVTFDQVVDYHGEIREKPESVEQAVAFIKSYSDNELGTVMTTVLYAFDTDTQVAMPNTTMTFYRAIDDAAIARIVERGLCLHTAGGFVVEDEDMRRSMIRIDPGTEDDVCGFCEKSVHALLAQVQGA